jgi:hypothetical protein
VAGAASNGESVEAAVSRIDKALTDLLQLDEYMGGDEFAADFADLKSLPPL